MEEDKPQHKPEDLEPVNIVIIDLNQHEIPLKIVKAELVLELIEYLSEHVFTCFFTNYSLEVGGKVLNEMADLIDVGLTEENNKIYMRTKAYDQNSSRK